MTQSEQLQVTNCSTPLMAWWNIIGKGSSWRSGPCLHETWLWVATVPLWHHKVVRAQFKVHSLKTGQVHFSIDSVFWHFHSINILLIYNYNQHDRWSIDNMEALNGIILWIVWTRDYDISEFIKLTWISLGIVQYSLCSHMLVLKFNQCWSTGETLCGWR